MNLICKLFHHKFIIETAFSTNVQLLRCTRCKELYGINHTVRAILPWDDDLEAGMKVVYPEHPFFEPDSYHQHPQS